MKKIAIALTALSLFAAPALADTIHTDGPNNPSQASQQASFEPADAQEFAATVNQDGYPQVQLAGAKSFYFGSPVSGGR